MNIKIKIGKRVRELRIKAKISQGLLAEYSGIDRTFISHIETGRRNISAETLDAVLYGLGVSFKNFFSAKDFG